MVILQFNKLIRNKWIWGAFAVAISFFFAFDFLLDNLRDNSDDRSERGSAGTIAGKTVKEADFQAIAEEIRGFGQQRDWKRPQHEVNRAAWETYAAMLVAERDGLVATDAEVAEMIRNDRTFNTGAGFNFQAYQLVLRENGLTPERYEEFLKRRMTVDRVAGAVLGSAAWTSPMELDRIVSDMTDTFVVKVANFAQEKADADKVALDDAGLRKWYDDNVKSLALPDRSKIRFVKFDATATNLLAKVVVTEDEMHDHYDASDDNQYVRTETVSNETKTVKLKFEEAKADIEKKLRQIAAVQCLETNLGSRVYGVKAADGKSRLDEIAKEEGLRVVTSDWFSLEGGYIEGFARHPSSILPGAQEFAEKVAELDLSSDDLRYGIVSGERAVWLVELAEVSPAHTPSFEEAQAAIRPRALRDAKADAFKASVEAVIAKGRDAVLASGNVSTNVTFVISDLQRGAFPDQSVIAGAARKLMKGDVSEFAVTGPGKAVVVVCEDRIEGDALKADLMRNQFRNEISMLQRRQLPEAWLKWNLDRLGFNPSDTATVTAVEVED